MEDYSCEVLIIGAGPAGLTAGLYCGRANRNTIILQGKEPSALTQAKEISNYPGYWNISGSELLSRFREQLKAYSNVKIMGGDVISLMVGMGANLISTKNANFTADAVIITTGRGHRKEQIKGEEKLIGFGVSYCALCDGPLYKDKTVYLYGWDEEVMEDALVLHQMGCKIKIITKVPMEQLPEQVQEVREKGIEIIDQMEITEIVPTKEGTIQKIVAKSLDPKKEGRVEVFELDCLFILSHLPSNSIFKKAGIELDDKGNIKVNEEQETNIKGIYAAGDVTGGLFQVVFATAEGARAAINANKYIRTKKKE
ncbi:MAG: NAD(P)/FAD-dependent oxidoreductase [Promethearchaeota archaeon]